VLTNVDSSGSGAGVEQNSILAKARVILDERKLEITKAWLNRLVGQLDDIEALERFPTQESIRTSVELIEGVATCLGDPKALEQFNEGGLYYKQAETLGLLQLDGAGAIGSLSDSLRALEDSIWDRLAEGLRNQDRDVLELVHVMRLAHTDPLTGLYNRHYWGPELTRHVELYKRYRHPFAILMLDLDNLKWVNDTFGHTAGDTALMHLATVMRMSIRDVDIPCRYGGDEFLILMPEAEKNAIQMVGRRISESINKTHFKLGRSFASLQVSFGAAACPENGVEADVLLAEADAGLYRAKEGKAERAGAAPSGN
jgi:diguanylate cyclase (GGDEF)-like protein